MSGRRAGPRALPIGLAGSTYSRVARRSPASPAARLRAEMDARQVALVYGRYLPARWAEIGAGYRAPADVAGMVAERRALYRDLVAAGALPLPPEEELIARLADMDDDDEDGDGPPFGPDGAPTPAAAWWTRVIPVRNDLASYGCEPQSSWAEATLAGLCALWGVHRYHDHDERHGDWSAPAADRLSALGWALQRTGHRADDIVARIEAAWPPHVCLPGPVRDVPYLLRYMAGATGSDYLDLDDDWAEMGYGDRPWTWDTWVEVFREWVVARAYIARARAVLLALTDPAMGAAAVRRIEDALAASGLGDTGGGRGRGRGG